jgi:hypothetical protein
VLQPLCYFFFFAAAFLRCRMDAALLGKNRTEDVQSLT